MKALSVDYHRNGVGGEPFRVVLFEDDDGTVKVAISFDDDEPEVEGGFVNPRVAVLQVDKLAAGDVRFGTNSWRGDHYARWVREQVKAKEGGAS